MQGGSWRPHSQTKAGGRKCSDQSPTSPPPPCYCLGQDHPIFSDLSFSGPWPPPLCSPAAQQVNTARSHCLARSPAEDYVPNLATQPPRLQRPPKRASSRGPSPDCPQHSWQGPSSPEAEPYFLATSFQRTQGFPSPRPWPQPQRGVRTSWAWRSHFLSPVSLRHQRCLPNPHPLPCPTHREAG